MTEETVPHDWLPRLASVTLTAIVVAGALAFAFS